MTDKKIIKGLRLEPELASLIEFAAASEGLTFSDFARKAIMKYLLTKTEFLKSRARQLMETLSYFEKSEDPLYIEQASKAMRLYPMEGAGLDYYIALEKAKNAAYSLALKGFEKSYADEVCRKYFTSGIAERKAFTKSLQDFIEDKKNREILGEYYKFARKNILGLEVDE
jgi:uncharacterized protein (DUF1778 family)